MRNITPGGCRLAWLPALLILAAVGAAAQPSPGRWTDHDLQFDYMGFTSHYSCQGLRDKVRMALVALGARPDLSVESVGCSETMTPRRLDRMPSVRLRFATLQPTDAGASPAAAAPVSGTWQNVQLAGPGKFGPGDCELLEQLAQQVVPLFAVRSMDRAPTCTPHDQPIRVSLRVESFRPTAAR